MTEHFDHRPKKHSQADTGDKAALGGFQQRTGKADHLGQHVLLAGELFEEFLFKHFLETKSFGNPE